MTNATKAVIVGVVNAAMQFAEAFGLYSFTDAQDSALTGLVNAAMLAYVLVTYKSSPARDPEFDAPDPAQG